nr:unnamed protein product [Digitaria exilis]
MEVGQLTTLREVCDLPAKEWRRVSLAEYLLDTRARCWKDPASISGRTLTRYAADLLDPDASWEANLSGMRLLDAFIRNGSDVKSLLLPSRSKGPQGAREMRELAARIVAHLAGDLHLSQFPGAIDSISSLLDEGTIDAYWGRSRQLERHLPQGET